MCLGPTGASKPGTGLEADSGLRSDAGLRSDRGLGSDLRPESDSERRFESGSESTTGLTSGVVETEDRHEKGKGPRSGRKGKAGIGVQYDEESLRTILPRVVRQLSTDAAALERFVEALLITMERRGVSHGKKGKRGGVSKEKGKGVMEMVFGASDLPPNVK